MQIKQGAKRLIALVGVGGALAFTGVAVQPAVAPETVASAEAETWPKYTYKYANSSYRESTCEMLYWSYWGRAGVNLVTVQGYAGGPYTPKCAVRVA